MAVVSSSGIESQFGYKAEATPGTAVTVDRFQEYLAESLNLRINRIQRNGLAAGRAIRKPSLSGTQWVEGNVELEFAPQNTALIWKHALGTITGTTGSGTYTHTVVPHSAWDQLAMTMQIGKPDTAGTVNPHTYSGMQIVKASLMTDASQSTFAKWTLGVYGRNEVTSTALASASYPSLWQPFGPHQAVLTIGGVEINLKKFTLNIDRMAATMRHRSRSTTATQPLQSKIGGFANISGNLVADFDSLAQYNNYVGGTVTTLVYALTSSAVASATISMNVEFMGDTPNVQGPQLLDQNLTFRAVSTTSDANALTVTIVNQDSSP